MSRARMIRFAGTASGHSQARVLLSAPGDISVDSRGTDRALVMLCPDGCGDVITINLDPRSGKAWRRDSRGDRLTIYPSIWREDGCRAHFIIWRDTILWCDWREGPAPDDEALVRHTSSELARTGSRFIHYEQIADALRENPWDVLWACAELVRRGEAEREGVSHFRPRNPGQRTERYA